MRLGQCWLLPAEKGGGLECALLFVSRVCAPFVSSVRSAVRFEAELLYMHLKVILVIIEAPIGIYAWAYGH